MKYILILILAFTCFSNLYAQEVLLEETPEDAYKKEKFGANRSHFFYTFYQFGFMVSAAETPMQYRPGSGDFAFGVRYKKRITGVISTGAELQIKYTNVHFKRNTALPYLDTLFTTNSIIHRRAKMGWNTLGISGFLRFNFDPGRGNSMGNYIEFTGGPEWIYFNDFITHDKQLNGTRVKTRYTRFPFMNPFIYNVQAKLGFNKIAIGAGYRFGNIFKNEMNLPEPPRLLIQLQFSAFRD